MKKSSIFYAIVFFLFLTCSYDHPIVSNDEDSGSADVSVNLGDIGSLGKIQNITFDTLTLVLFAPGEDSIIAKISLSGNSEKTVKKYFPKLVSFKTWTVSATAKDKAGKTTHCGALTFEVQPHETTPVTLALPAMYSMLKAKFFPIRDSVYAVKLWVDGAIAADSSFGRTALRGDTVKVSYDYLTASPTGIQHAIRMDARAIVWGDDTVLYRGDTVVTAVSGVNGGYFIKLKCMIKNPPPGSACMTVRLGAIGTVTIDGELENKQMNDILDANAVSKAASDKIHEWLQSGSIEEARDKLVGFLNTQELVKDVSVTDDGSVVSVEYVNGLKAVALFGQPGTISYPNGSKGITISVSADTILTDPNMGWLGRNNERKYVYSKLLGTSLTRDSMHDVAVTLDTLTKLGDYGFIHIASHGGIDKSGEQIFLSGVSALYTIDPEWIKEGMHKKEAAWYLADQIIPDLHSGLWAVRPSFISSTSFASLPQSIVILSFCKSIADANQAYDGMWQAFKAKGAKAVVGWKGVPDTGFAREAVSLMMDRMVDSGKTVSEACHIADSIMKFKYPAKKDSLKVKGDDPDMQLTFRLTTSGSPAIGGTIGRSADAGSYKNGEVVTLTAKANAGYRFTGWTGGITGTANPTNVTMNPDMAITANFIRQYTVSFNSQGGSSAPSQVVDAGGKIQVPNAPTQNCYTFGEWFKESACINKWDFAKDIVFNDATLYAKWTINQFTVSFDAQGGSAVASQTISCGNLAQEPSSPMRTGYTFGGWFRESAYIIPWNFSSDNVIGPITLYAQWNPILYKVKYDGNGQSEGNTPSIMEYPSGSEIAVMDNSGKLVGGYKSFAGWTCDGKDYTCGEKIIINTDMTFYAKYSDLMVMDNDGNIYTSIDIEGLRWMVQNLKTTKLNDGTSIPLIQGQSDWSSLSTQGYSWYSNDMTNKDNNGALYNWYTVNSNKLTPAGWRIPTESEWNQMILAEYNSTHPKVICQGNICTSQSSCQWSPFPVILGGSRNEFGEFKEISNSGVWWSLTEYNVSRASNYFVNQNSTDIGNKNDDKKCGFSVRCVRESKVACL